MIQDETTILFRVRKTVFQMLRDRGYTVSDQSYSQTNDSFKNEFNGSRESLNMLFQKSDAIDQSQTSADTFAINEQKILVFYPGDDKVGSNTIK